MRLNPYQISKLVKNIVFQLETAGIVLPKDEAEVSKIVETIIVNDLKREDELEKEAEALIRKHTANIHSDELDYEMLVKRAKYELAKKKGIKL
ncbi:MAG: DUF507 family protein [bacterium]